MSFDMHFGPGLFLFIVTLPFHCKCHFWIQDYPYNSDFFIDDLYNEIDIPLNYPTSPLQDFDLSYQDTQFQHDNTLVYKKILENQLRAYSIIADLESNLPCELRHSRGSFCGNVLPKEIFFEDYPHLKALLQLQWKRLRNSLQGHKLSSLRIDSPLYRP